MARCECCGAPLREGDSFCANCGARISQSVSSAVYDPGQQQPAQVQNVVYIPVPVYAKRRPRLRRKGGWVAMLVMSAIASLGLGAMLISTVNDMKIFYWVILIGALGFLILSILMIKRADVYNKRVLSEYEQ